jgi:hypothetical protein
MGAISDKTPSTTFSKLSIFASVKIWESVVSSFNVVSAVSVFVDGGVRVSEEGVVCPTLSSNVVMPENRQVFLKITSHV